MKRFLFYTSIIILVVIAALGIQHASARASEVQQIIIRTTESFGGALISDRMTISYSDGRTETLALQSGSEKNEPKNLTLINTTLQKFITQGYRLDFASNGGGTAYFSHLFILTKN